MIIFLDIDRVLNDFPNIEDDILVIDHPHNPGTFIKSPRFN